jgi:beta-glucosidase
VNVATDPTLRRRPTAAVPTFRAMVGDRGVSAGYRLGTRPSMANCLTTAVAPEDRSACEQAAG